MKTSPPIIGIVGGVGSGKSTVAAMLRDLGCVVADSDLFAREALRDATIKAQIVEWWSDDVLDPATGDIDRRKIAAIVFSDAAQRSRLESLTHPWIEHRRRTLLESTAANDVPAFVIDAPLLLEAGLGKECDAILFVDAPPELRERRVKTRSQWSHSQWQARESAQMPLDEKRAQADHVVINRGNLSDLQAAVANTLQRIIADVGRGGGGSDGGSGGGRRQGSRC